MGLPHALPAVLRCANSYCLPSRCLGDLVIEGFSKHALVLEDAVLAAQVDAIGEVRLLPPAA